MSDHAIVIGISEYPGLRNLSGPCHDARLFADWLQRSDGGGLERKHIALMLTDDYPTPTSVGDALPAETELNNIFRPFAIEAALGKHVDGRLFIFVAGHGFADPQSRDSAALLAANAEDLWPCHLAVERYAEYFCRTYAFKEVILIMDACRTVNPLLVISPPSLPLARPHPNASKVKYFRAYGAAYNHVARERTFSNGCVQGIFTMAVIDALNTALPNQAGRVNGSAIKRCIHNRIEDIAGEQHVDPPEITVDENRDVFFVSRTGPSVNVQFEIPPGNDQKELVIAFGDMQRSERFLINAAELTVPLSPGLYKVSIDGTDPSQLVEVPHDGPVQL